MQQTGRAGHDGRPLSALLMFDGRRETKKLGRMIEGRAKTSFETMLRAVDGNFGICVRRVLSRYFGSRCAT